MSMRVVFAWAQIAGAVVFLTYALGGPDTLITVFKVVAGIFLAAVIGAAVTLRQVARMRRTMSNSQFR